MSKLNDLRIVWIMVVLFLSLIVSRTITADSPKKADQNQKATTMNKEKNGEVPFACNMKALDKNQRTSYSAITKQLHAEKKEVRELPDGYAFRFDASSERIKNLAEFITYERLCCPFFDFELNVERNEGDLWLKLKGREGVKEFIKTEFGL